MKPVTYVVIAFLLIGLSVFAVRMWIPEPQPVEEDVYTQPTESMDAEPIEWECPNPAGCKG